MSAYVAICSRVRTYVVAAERREKEGKKRKSRKERWKSGREERERVGRTLYVEDADREYEQGVELAPASVQSSSCDIPLHRRRLSGTALIWTEEGIVSEIYFLNPFVLDILYL
jgi:hypothetical protein